MGIRESGRGAALVLILASQVAGGGRPRDRMRPAREVWRELRAASRSLSLHRAGASTAAPTAGELLRTRLLHSRQLFENRRASPRGPVPLATPVARGAPTRPPGERGIRRRRKDRATLAGRPE